MGFVYRIYRMGIEVEGKSERGFPPQRTFGVLRKDFWCCDGLTGAAFGGCW